MFLLLITPLLKCFLKKKINTSFNLSINIKDLPLLSIKSHQLRYLLPINCLKTFLNPIKLTLRYVNLMLSNNPSQNKYQYQTHCYLLSSQQVNKISYANLHLKKIFHPQSQQKRVQPITNQKNQNVQKKQAKQKGINQKSKQTQQNSQQYEILKRLKKYSKIYFCFNNLYILSFFCYGKIKVNKDKMECKFKQISQIKGSSTIPIRNTQTAVNEALNCLLGNVGDHVYNTTALQKSKSFLKNKIINFQIDSVKQVYPPRPTIPNLIQQQQSPRIAIAQCMRPMSAQVRHYSRKNTRVSMNTQSKKTIQSYGSLSSHYRTKRNTTSTTSLLEVTKRKKNFQKKTNNNEKRFFAVKSTCDEEEVNVNFIEQLRSKKVQQQNQLKKKQQFLKSIQLQSTNYSTSQAKFIQSISRKKFIYGSQGQVIQINSNNDKNHLKKISAMSKSRVQIKQKSTAELKKFQQELKQNIYIQFKGRDTHQSRPQTGKPHLSSKAQEFKNKFLSAKQTKRHQQQGLNKLGQRNEQNKKTGTQRIKQDKKGQDKGLTKKRIQKILFYQTPNSVYRVVNEAPILQTNDKLTIEDL